MKKPHQDNIVSNELTGGRANARKSDGYLEKFLWRTENLTKLKDILKKRKIAGLCVKSRQFQVGDYEEMLG
ncbi:hypothetical protein SUGI_1127490 [Cryptomeria japonica]|nr:hypothetical protein SUGI_1127490 [Cryptomeria japonica]